MVRWHAPNRRRIRRAGRRARGTPESGNPVRVMAYGLVVAFLLIGALPGRAARAGADHLADDLAVEPRRRSATPLEGGAVAVARVVGTQHGDRHAQPGVGEQRRLVVHLARHAAAPAALERDCPAARQRPRRCPSAARDDRAQEPHRVPAVAPRHEPVDAEEEPRLVGGGDRRAAPHRVRAKWTIAPGARARSARAGRRAVDRVRRTVVGAPHHRVQQRPLARPEPAPRTSLRRR